VIQERYHRLPFYGFASHCRRARQIFSPIIPFSPSVRF